MAKRRRKNHLHFDLGEMEMYKYLVSTGRAVLGPAVETRILSSYRKNCILCIHRFQSLFGLFTLKTKISRAVTDDSF